MTQEAIVLKYLQFLRNENPEDGWIEVWKLAKTDTPYGWLGSEGGRRARELYKRGSLEKKRVGKYEYYRYKIVEIPEVTSKVNQLNLI